MNVKTNFSYTFRIVCGECRRCIMVQHATRERTTLVLFAWATTCNTEVCGCFISFNTDAITIYQKCWFLTARYSAYILYPNPTIISPLGNGHVHGEFKEIRRFLLLAFSSFHAGHWIASICEHWMPGVYLCDGKIITSPYTCHKTQNIPGTYLANILLYNGKLQAFILLF